MKRKLLILIALLSTVSCNKPLFSSDKLSIQKHSIEPANIKLNGYFYSLNNNTPNNVLILYRNSTIFTFHVSNNLSLADVDNQLIKQEFLEHSKQSRFYWGRWNLNSYFIEYEKWVARDGPYPVIKYEGLILNDSTLKFHTSYRSKNNKDKKNIDETFYYRPYSPKSDSTNKFTD